MLGSGFFVTLFLSTFVNKTDRKGRVSVPAAFRAALDSQPQGSGVVLFRSHAHACLEGFSMAVMQELSARLDHYDLFSAEQDDMAAAIFGEAVHLLIDGDGRILLPAPLITFAGLEEQAAFVGMGRKFQIWNPVAYERRREDARKNVRTKGLTLPKGAAA